MTLFSNRRILLLWCYAIEFTLAAAVYVLILTVGLEGKCLLLLSKSSNHLVGLFGLMLGVAFGGWAMFATFNSGEFGAWLQWKKMTGIFSGAFFVHAMVFALAAVCVAIEPLVVNLWFSRLSLILTMIGTVNVLTLSILFLQLVLLQALFNNKFLSAERKEAKGS